jgi:hypothetical protein
MHCLLLAAARLRSAPTMPVRHAYWLRSGTLAVAGLQRIQPCCQPCWMRPWTWLGNTVAPKACSRVTAVFLVCAAQLSQPRWPCRAQRSDCGASTKTIIPVHKSARATRSSINPSCWVPARGARRPGPLACSVQSQSSAAAMCAPDSVCVEIKGGTAK